MKDLLKDIFNNAFLISKNGTVTISEKEKDGKCSCILKSSSLHEFHNNNLKKTTDPFISGKHSSVKFGMRNTCDGIILDYSKNLNTIYFIELKKNIAISNLKKAINQLQATRVRLLSLLSITSIDLQKINSVFIIVGNIYKNNLPAENQNRRERISDGETALALSNLQIKKEANIPSVPKSLKEKINCNYQTSEEIKFLHYKCGETININEIK